VLHCSLLNRSRNLALVLVALNNSCKKRIEAATKATASFLNNVVFPVSGTHRNMVKILGMTGERAGMCPLEMHIPKGFQQTIFPMSDAEVPGKPLIKGARNKELELAIGLLRMFDARKNSSQPGGEPNFDFFDPNRNYVRGGGADPYGPLWPQIFDTTCSPLAPYLSNMIQQAKKPYAVQSAMAATINR